MYVNRRDTSLANLPLMNRNTNQTTVFLHIPKTAGTTFHSALTWQFWRKKSFWIHPHDLDASSFKALDPETCASFSLVRGHMFYGIHEWIPHPATYVTFVRDPVARIVSYYHFARREAAKYADSEHWWYQAFRSCSLRDLIRSGADVELENGQVRRISGVGFRQSHCTASDLDQALENLQTSFAAVGVTERFDISLQLIARALQWERPLLYRTSNTSKQPRQGKNCDPATLQEIRDANELDAKLYAEIVRRIDRAVHMDPTIDRRANRVRHLNQVLHPLMALGRLPFRALAANRAETPRQDLGNKRSCRPK